jgi:hypothetical protein
MTVTELITRLESFPPEMEVWDSSGSRVLDAIGAGEAGARYVVIISGTGRTPEED